MAESETDPAAAATIERAAALLALAELPEGYAVRIYRESTGGHVVTLYIGGGDHVARFSGPRAIEEAAAWAKEAGR